MKSFAQLHARSFLQSFTTLNKRFLLCLVYEALFYGVLILFGSALLEQVLARGEAIDIAQNLLLLNEEQAGTMLTDLRGFVTYIIASVILFVIAIIFAASLFQGLMWSTITKKHYQFKPFFWLNLKWIPSWIIGLIAAGVLFQGGSVIVLMGLIMFLGLFLTNVVYAVHFLHTNKAIRKSVALFFSNVHHFIVSLIIISLVYMILFTIFGFIPLAGVVQTIIMYSLLVVFLVWMRYYLAAIIKTLLKRNA